jgi:hypothetical protein
VTREQALTAIRAQAIGLEPDLAGCARLLERLSVHAESECLRDALTELGARALLESIDNGSVRSGTA